MLQKIISKKKKMNQNNGATYKRPPSPTPLPRALRSEISPHYKRRALRSPPVFYITKAVSHSGKKKFLEQRTSPYKNREGTPVMTEMIEKDTPKFYAQTVR
jgi:hypothetical protein